MKRGQVTMFVIVGLAILLLVGVAYLAIDTGEAPTLQAEQDVALVRNLVQQCLQQTGQEAVQQTAQRGGYYALASIQERTNYESQVLTMAGQKIPLWHEVHSCQENDLGCIGDNRPALCSGRDCPLQIDGGNPDVTWQSSIEQYIEDNLAGCLAGFEQLPLQIEIENRPDTSVRIRDDSVLLELEYPLSVLTTDQNQVELDEFTTTLDVNLVQTYELATQIYALERDTLFMEEQFLSLLTAYSGIDSEIPPMREAQLTGGERFWVRRNVQDTIEEQVLPFLNFLQIVNAMESYAPIESPNVDEEMQGYAAGAFNYMDLKLGSKVYPLGVQFEYPYQDIYLDINGEEFLSGKEMPGTDFMSIVGGLTFIEYKFSYDVTFPLVVRITDPAAFNGQGLDFYYAMEANILNNQPLNTSADIITFRGSDISVDLAQGAQLVDHTYEISVIDRLTDEPVPDVGITYVCGSEFTMGATGPDGIWMGKLPYCAAGGFVKAETFEHMGTAVAQDNSEDDGLSSSLQIHLWPRREKQVVLYKRTADDILNLGGTLSEEQSMQHRTNLSRNETVLVMLSRHKETPYDTSVPFAGVLQFGERNTQYGQNNTITVLQQALAEGRITQETYDETVEKIKQEQQEQISVRTVDLVPGTYDITGFLTYYGLVQIPAEERCAGGFLTQECRTLPARNFTSWNSGGVVLTQDTAVTFTPEDVYSDGILVLYVLEQGVPGNWSAIERYQNFEDYQTYQRRQMVLPRFS